MAGGDGSLAVFPVHSNRVGSRRAVRAAGPGWP
jgi:hypothetical protein